MSSGGKDPTQKPNAPTRLGFRSTLSSFRKKISRSVSPSNRSSQTIPDDQSSGSPVASRPSSTYITVPVASPGIPINTYTQTPSSSPSIVLSAADSGAQISAPLPGPATPRAIVLGPSTITSPPKFSPWEKAVQKLSAQDQKEFDFYNQDGLLKVLDDVLKAANEKRELCRERMWKITWNGKIIVLRDIADKTIEWVNKFKTLGNIIAQGDPVHAAIPWAPIRYLIEFIIKDSQKMGEMLVGIEVITNLLGRCAIYEELYLGTGFDTAQRVEDALIALYADMLTYMINAKHYYSENTAARIAWGVLDTDGPAEALVALQVKESKVFEESHLAEAKNQNAANIKAEERSKELQKLLNEFEMPISRIEKNVEALIDGLEDSKRGKILDWISTTPYSKYHRTAKKSRRQGTCEWLLNSNQFKQWQYSNASALLWLRGDPGAGKTTLTSMVVDAIDQKPASGSDETFAYFYCKRGEGLLNDPTEIMRSILRQLSFKGSGRVLHKPVIAEYQKRTDGKTLDDGLGLGDCLDIIVTLINLNRRTTIIIDALDECNNESRHELFNGLRKILHDSSSLVKVFISSRNDDDIKLQFKREPNIYIEETHNATDIKSYINEELSGCVEGRRLLRGNVDDLLKELIISKLLEKAHGMFLWAELQIKELCALSLESEVREMLDNFPTSLEETYMEIYKRVQRKKGAAPKIAKNALMWVMCACRPLSPEELAAMLSQQTKGSTIEIDILLDVCCNFLKLDHQLNVVRFFHLSVEEFLEKGTIFTRLEANAMVAELSLSVLIYMDKSIQHTRRYSVFYWMVHVQRFSNLDLREGGWDKDREKIWDILRVFFRSLETPSPAFTYWIKCFDEFKRTVEFTDRFKIESLHEEQYKHSRDVEDLCPLPSYVASIFGFGEKIRGLWDNEDIDFNAQNARGESLLYLASGYGNEDVVGVLLDKGADINAQGGEYGNALQVAASGGHEKIVQTLLDRGAEINAQGGYYGNALQAAALGGHEKIVQTLLDRGAEINAQGGRYGNALQAAASGGHEKIVQTLLDRGAEINAQGGLYGNALQAAASGEHEKIVQTLLDGGAEINAQGGYYGNALQAAAHGGHEKIVQTLLDRGAEINAQGGIYCNALQAAAREEHRKIVRILKDRGAIPKADV